MGREVGAPEGLPVLTIVGDLVGLTVFVGRNVGGARGNSVGAGVFTIVGMLVGIELGIVEGIEVGF